MSQSNDNILLEIKKHQKIELTRSLTLTLASDYYKGRNVLDSSVRNAQKYIINVLKSQHIAALDSSYLQGYPIQDSLIGQNIVGIHRGNKSSNDAILILANYDNLGVIFQNDIQDMIFNGANDNVSGVVSLIQMAIFFSRIRLHHNVIFAFTSGKRLSLRGACALAGRLETSPYKISSSFHLEMIGRRPSKKRNNLFIKSFGTDSSLSVRFNAYLHDSTFSSFDDTEDFISYGFEGSAIHNILNIPSYSISSFDIEDDDLYMTPYDDYEHLDINFLHSSIEKITYSLSKYMMEGGTSTR